MMDDPAIEVRQVGKRYTKYEDTPLLVTTAARFSRHHRRQKFWAVRGVTFDVPQRDSFGIIGRNGSGKTTLMSMMAGVTAPTEGALRVKGRIAPLISVGVGFHRELTGRENVYLNGNILGLTRRQIDERFDAIVDFAEIASSIDTPVKFYSSGMFVRLGFSVAVHCDPDVILVDEILAVGDLGFQVKCFERMAKLVEDGTTVVMISHNMAAVQRLARRILLLDMGRPVYLGPPEEAIARYHELLEEQTGGAVDESGTVFQPGLVQIASLELFGSDGEPVKQVSFGTPLVAKLSVRSIVSVDEVVAGFSLTGPDGQIVYMDSNVDRPFERLEDGEEAVFSLSFTVALPSGTYSMTAWVQQGLRTLLARSRPVSFFVTGRPSVRGAADLGGLIVKEAPPGDPMQQGTVGASPAERRPG